MITMWRNALSLRPFQCNIVNKWLKGSLGYEYKVIFYIHLTPVMYSLCCIKLMFQKYGLHESFLTLSFSSNLLYSLNFIYFFSCLRSLMHFWCRSGWLREDYMLLIFELTIHNRNGMTLWMSAAPPAVRP